MGTWMRYERSWLDGPDEWETIARADLEIALRQEFHPGAVERVISEMDRGVEAVTRHARYRRVVNL